MKLSLILPCYNPPKGWAQNIYTVYRQFRERIQCEVELVIVFDGPCEAVTSKEIDYLEQNISTVELISYDKNRGKGYAIRKGVAKSTGEIIIYTDIDFPYTIDSMCAIFESLVNDGNDAAIGVKDQDYYTHLPAARRMISRSLRVLIRFFLSTPITDTQCGLKGFRKKVKPVFLNTTIDRYLFDLEFVRNCFQHKELIIAAVPVTLNKGVHFRNMNYSILLPELLNFVKLLFKKKNA